MKQLKRLANVGLAMSMGVVMTGCNSGTAVEKKVDAQETYGCNVLNIYNAGEYIAENVVPDFEKMYNARVNYDTFESNEILYTKLLGGSSYDVLIPSDYMIERLISEGMLQKLNKEQITNEKDMNESVLAMRDAFDEGGEYAVPYFWGSVGIVYDTTVVDEKTIKEQGWEILRNTDYKGNLYYYDSQRDGFMVAFKALGYSMNTDNPDEINEAYEWLREMNATMSPAYVTDEVIDGMTNSEKALAVMYSGDAAAVLKDNPDMAWYEPESGTNNWVDAMVIPANASCAGLANEFINYVASYDVQYANSEYVGYSPARLDVQEKLAEGDYAENPAYSPRTGYAKDEVFHYNEALTKQLSDLWNKVKIQ